jgi:hypothetical protein
MVMEELHRLDDETLIRMAYLADNDYHCSQIILKLSLEKEGVENPDLIRSMYGLAEGCWFLNGTCGILSGSACLISWYAGKKTGRENVSDEVLPMLQDLVTWFKEEVKGKFNSPNCSDIVGDRIGTTEGVEICGNLLIKTYAKVNEILESYGFIDSSKL